MMLGIMNLLTEALGESKKVHVDYKPEFRGEALDALVKVQQLIKQAITLEEEKSELSEGTRQRVIRSLGRFIAEATHREDDCRGNLDNGSKGGYSEELTEDIKLLDELKEPVAAGPGGRHHDEDTLAAAYKTGFEDAKKIILKEIQLLGKHD